MLAVGEPESALWLAGHNDNARGGMTVAVFSLAPRADSASSKSYQELQNRYSLHDSLQKCHLAGPPETSLQP
jgi:hypothetical protein